MINVNNTMSNNVIVFNANNKKENKEHNNDEFSEKDYEWIKKYPKTIAALKCNS